MTSRRIRTTCPRDCYDSCGIEVDTRDGVVHRVVGDPCHPVSRGALCGKCALAYNGAWRDESVRLKTPLRRAGPKGAGVFEPVSWDTALQESANRLHGVVDQYGAQAVLNAHYTGTCSLLAGEFPMRFFNRLGATEITPDTICNNAGHVALQYLLGSSVTGFDPKTIADANCLMIWGANPSASAPHVDKHWLAESSARLVVIDPVRHATADRADLFLQPFPGSDAALAFGLLHVLHRDGLVDDEFLRLHTLGWDEVARLLPDCTPQWTAEVTGVAAEQIIQAAGWFGEGPGMLWLGQGLQRQPTGGNVFRACAMLPVATGSIGKAGGGVYFLNGTGPRGIDGDYVSAPHLRRGVRSEISHMALAAVLDDPARSRALFCWNMNLAASAPRQTELRRALRRDDLFTVVVDLFQTDTADFADIVLPAASFLEFDDLVLPYFHLLVSAQRKVCEPPGEALSNQAIFRRLARAMNFTDEALFESDRSVIDHVLTHSRLGFSFAELAQQGTIDPWRDAQIAFESLVFATPSGKIELASESAQSRGHPRTALPLHDVRPASGRFRLLSPSGNWQLNGSYGNDAAVRRTLGEVSVAINESDAERLDVAQGDPLRLQNETGSLDACAEIVDTLPSGVLLMHKGRWPRFEPSCSNVNVLNPGLASDMGQSSAVHGIEVQVEKR